MKVSRILHDRDEVRLGGNTLVAVLTPGHTKGCTTWTLKTQDGGKTYNVVIVGSAGVNDAHYLVNNASYPDVIADYQHTFQRFEVAPLRRVPGIARRVLWAARKYRNSPKGGPNPFIDPNGCKEHAKLMEQAFYYKLDWVMRQ